MNNINMMTVYQ